MKNCIPILVLSFLSAAMVDAQYYRFESGAEASDLSGSLNLSSSPTTNTSIGSFFDPIPQTGAANGQAATGTAQTAATGALVSGSDSLTVEGFFNTSVSANESDAQQTIAAQWGGGAGNIFRMNLQAVDGGDEIPGGDDFYRFRFGLRQLNNDQFFITSSLLQMSANTDYYFAAVFDNTEDELTFYVQDLSNSGDLLSETIAQGFGNWEDGTASISIGATQGGSDAFSGSLDEIRLTGSTLSRGELLAIPEPGTYALLSGLLAIGAVMARRRK